MRDYVPKLTEKEKLLPKVIIKECGREFHFSYGVLVAVFRMGNSMERLTIDEVIAHCKRHTERMENHSGRMQLEETPIGNSNIMKQYWEHRQTTEWLEQLKDYKNAEEQGLLLRLPCKEIYTSSGDTVYYIFDYEIVECINCGVSMDCEGKLWIALACDEHIFPYRNPDSEHDLDPTDWCINSTQVTIDEWGKTVFLTEEEAEQALKRMEGE